MAANSITCADIHSNVYYNKDSNLNTTFAHGALPCMVYDDATTTLKVKEEVECEKNIKTDEIENLTVDT